MPEDPKHNEKWQESIGMRISAEMDKMIEILKEQPIVALACRKIGLSPSTYYRWLRNNPIFKYRADHARKEGRSNLNDVVESALIVAAKKGEPWAIRFYLEHQSTDYVSKQVFDIGREKENDKAITPIPRGEITAYLRALVENKELMKKMTSEDAALNRALENLFEKIESIASPELLGEGDM